MLADIAFIISDVGSWQILLHNVIWVSDSNSCFDWKLNKVGTDWIIVTIYIIIIYVLQFIHKLYFDSQILQLNCNSYRERENYTSSDTFNCTIKYKETAILMSFKYQVSQNFVRLLNF